MVTRLGCRQMKKLRRVRVVMATSEKLTVWYANRKDPTVENSEEVSVECPHCGKEAFSFEIERSEHQSTDDLYDVKAAR